MMHLLRKVFAFSLLMLAANLLPAQQALFVKTPPVLNPGGFPLGTAVADFNGDGIPDVVAVTETDAFVYIGNGDGTFQPAIVTPGSYFPIAIAVGDFNNDGKHDLVIAGGSFAPVLLLLGNGDGTFEAPLTIASTGNFPALGDFNGDKNLDLALYTGSSVIVLLGNGAGGFTQSTALPVSSAGGIAVGQINTNSDRKLDMAVSNPNSNMVSIYLGNGDGTFGSASTITVGLSPGPLAIRDLNGDQKADLAVADAGSSDVAAILGNGDGTFQTPTANPVPLGIDALGSLVIADFNNDRILDIAVLGYVLLGTGGGKFQAPVSYPLISGAVSVVAGDLNHDGKLDLVIDVAPYSLGPGFVSILLGKGNGSFRGAPDVSVGTMPTSIAVADFNGDGLPDFVTVNQSSSSLSVALGTGHGSFGAATSVALGFSGVTFPSQIAAGDFNKDGKVDLVVGCGTPGESGFCGTGGLAVLLGDGNGGFQAPVFIPDSEFDPTGIVVADFNNDGNPDIVVAAPQSSNIFMYGVIVYLGNGNGTFQAPINAYVANAQGLAAGDFNRDGRLDLAVGQGSSVAILLGNGNGTFTNPYTFNTAYGTSSIAVADLNGDKKPDVAVGGGFPGGVSIFLGNGDGTFQPERTSPAALGVEPGGMVAADYNLDGKTDLAFLSSNSVSILPGNGDGSFQAAQIFGVESGPTGIAKGAFNSLKNIKPGLVVANGGSNTVSVLNNSTP